MKVTVECRRILRPPVGHRLNLIVQQLGSGSREFPRLDCSAAQRLRLNNRSQLDEIPKFGLVATKPFRQQRFALVSVLRVGHESAAASLRVNVSARFKASKTFAQYGAGDPKLLR